MKTNEQKYWFPAKKYGWGWGPPCTWQGWTVWLVWLALLLAGGFILTPRNIGLFVCYSIALGAALMAVSFIKGEKPGWRWGNDECNRQKSSAERLAELNELHSQKLISDTEYEAKRQDILKEL